MKSGLIDRSPLLWSLLGVWVCSIGMAQELHSQICTVTEHHQRGCELKAEPGGPINFEDCFIDGFRSYGRQQWQACIEHMTAARQLCPEETLTVKFNSRNRVSYVPTLYLWAATYRCDRGDPSRLIKFFRDLFSKWDLTCIDDTRVFLASESQVLTAENRQLDVQIRNFELSLKTISPNSARELCRRLLEILRISQQGHVSLDDHRLWERLAREEGYDWSPQGQWRSEFSGVGGRQDLPNERAGGKARP